jgi:hypothetical protein
MIRVNPRGITIFVWLVSMMLSLSLSLAAAQNSHSNSSPSIKPAPDPMQHATPSLTPKSAMPTHKYFGAATPRVSGTERNSSQELSRLERGSAPGASAEKTPKAAAYKAPAASADSSPKINARYQPPKAGVRATNEIGKNPNARMKKTK